MLTRWSVLRKTGFSGVDAITPEIDVLPWSLSIIAAQAVDAKVNFLRRPLAHSSFSNSIYLDSLVILGTGTLETARMAEELAEHLGQFCGHITVLQGLPTETEAMALDPMSTFINLVDLDDPIFKSMTAEKMEGLKRLYELAKNLLWITLGAQADEAYHMASIAFSRAMSHEAGHINMSHLDLSDLDHNASKVIAEYLLRQCALDEWEVPGDRHKHQTFLWSKEPEAFLDNGKLMIPRLISNFDQNARLNSSRRVVKKTVSISSSNVSISLSGNGKPSLIEEVLPVALKADQPIVRVEASSVKAIHVAADTFLYLGIGKDQATSDTVVVLSQTNSSETAPTASVAVKNLNQFADRLLIAIASELIAASLVETLPANSSILVHGSGKDRFLAVALSRRADAAGIRVTFSCDAESTDRIGDPTWIKLSARAPRYVVRKMLLVAKPTHFLDLTAHSLTEMSDLSRSIADVLPSGYKRIDPSVILQNQSFLPLSSDRENLTGRLEDCVSNARAIATSTAHESVEDLVISLAQLHDPSLRSHTTSAVHWAVDGEVEVEVRPLDPKRLFSQDKSYLLVGLTGQIGRSLCEWMVANGAGCVCLTSRNPKNAEKWLKSFKTTNAIVKVFAMDITDKSSLERVVKEIRETCPPIGGVANGAMVLHDALFSGMSLETMQAVLGPKIDGTNNLDELFHDDDLDFFVLFSSSACVIGNSGQANYAAANGYINGIAKQRRKRGLAASAFDIGRVAGLGYVETAGQAVMDQLTRFGLMAISESEFQKMFAETIRAGYPNPKDSEGIPEAVVTTGIRTIRDDEEIQGPWFENPRFSHCIIEAKSTASGTEQGNKKTSVPVGEQLSKATTMEEALEILQGKNNCSSFPCCLAIRLYADIIFVLDCFSTKLRIILQISDQTIDPNTTLVELGVDSLVAVEVRSWFLKELKVDIPVLKVVGGASIAELCQRALDKLPEELLSNIGGEAVAAKPAVTQSLPKIQVAASSSASSTSPTPSLQSSNDTATSISSMQLSSKSVSSDKLVDDAKAAAAPEQPAKRFLKSEPLSFGQSRFWFLRRLLEDQTTSNVAFYYHIAGSLRIGAMERAIRIVTARHEALRTCFVEDETEADQAFQKVTGSSPLRLEQKKISSVDEIAAEYATLQRHVFNLESGELIRLVLLTLSPTSHYLLVNYHHILMDGVSFQVFLSDLEKAYSGQSLGPAPRQFPDFSAAQRKAYESGEMNDELKYWRGVFPAGEQPLVLPLLPMARNSSRISMKNFGVHQVGARIDPGLSARIKAISKAQRSTPFHFYLAAYKAMLFSFTDAQDLTIGIADANRNDSDVAGSIGFFLNLLTLRFRRHQDQNFADAILEARNTAYAALENSRLPFDVLLKELNVGRSSTHSPFFQAFFDYRQGAQEKHAWGNTQFEFQEVHPGRTAYDITLDVTDNGTDALIMFRTQKSLYDLTAANLLLETYFHFLEVVSNDTSLALKAIPLFSQKQLTKTIEIGVGK
jgi:hybrid polyketide synthase/nonribosomal peptide synthetase ACE1